MSITPPHEEKHYSLPIRRPVTMAMLFLTLIVFGWYSYQRLPINLMPDISYPTLTVRTEYEGAAPEDVEKLLTRPLEETLSIVGGMVEISSTSSPGVSEIVLEFTWDTDMNAAQQDVRDRLDLFTPPREVTEKPVILRYDPTLDPVMRVAVTGSDVSHIADERKRRQRESQELTLIRDQAERHVKSDLEAQVEGVAQVVVKGGREEEIQVLVDSERLKSLGLSLTDITNRLAAQNINLSGGRLKEGKTEYLVRTLNEFRDVSEIEDVVIGTPQTRTSSVPQSLTLNPRSGMGAESLPQMIRLRDVATVKVGSKDRDTVVRINGLEAVELEIFKEGDANTVRVCNKLKDVLGFHREVGLTEQVFKMLVALSQMPSQGASSDDAKTEQQKQEALVKALQSHLPGYARLTLISDQSRFIQASIKEVQDAAVQGGLLALMILYFFLRELKSTLAIGIAIPISIITAFIPMFMLDISLNIMSLGGLALGVGNLVDCSIVVLESIARCREEGDSVKDAANRGTREVRDAIMASTFTTVAVYLPIAFVEGVGGQLFKDHALVVTFGTLTSLVVALLLNPMLASRGGWVLLSGKNVMWLLRAYRVSKRMRKPGSANPTWLIGAYMLRRTTRWFTRTAAATFGPTLRAIRGTEGVGDGGMRASSQLQVALDGVDGQRRTSNWQLAVTRPFHVVAGCLVLPLLLCMFVFSMVVQCLGLALSALLFCLSILIAFSSLVVGTLLRLILWLPLKVFDLCYATLRHIYELSVRQALRFGPVVVLLTIGVAIHSGTLAAGLGRELIPPMKQGEFGIRMAAPPGTRLEETEERARRIEALIMRAPEVATVATVVGISAAQSAGTRGENIADFNIQLKNPDETIHQQDAIIDRLRKDILAISPDEIAFSLPALFSFKTAVELQLRGEETAELRRVGEVALETVRQVPGVTDAELSIRQGYPEVIIALDRDLMAAKNLSPDQVARRLRNEVQGEIATRFNRAGDKIDIRVRSDQERLQTLQNLRTLSVVDGYPPISLNTVARVDVQIGPSEIRRIDQRQVAVISANVAGRDLGAVSRDILERVSTVEKPVDYQFVLGGQNRELSTSYKSLQLALVLAVFLVYVVMACQFESVIHPALIMFSIPMALIGVIYVLVLLHIDLSISVYIGGIVLIGIVVNNAIVLVDYINQLRERGLPKREAIILAGTVRLRPIIMTTVTTVLGLVPMALYMGEGSEIRRPMAITVMAGLICSTVLTLIVIPAIYDIFGGKDKLEGRASSRPKA